MMTKITAFAGLALLAACGSAPATGNEAKAQPPAASSATALAIAGITTTTTAPAAVQALRQDGWSIKRGSGKTWDKHVADEVDRQRGTLGMGTYTVDAGDIYATKGDEKIEITVRPSPRGGAIETVNYHAPIAGRPIPELGPTLLRKYGKPSSGTASTTGFNLKWCAPAGCNSGKPYLTARSGGYPDELRIILFWGTDQHQAWDREVAAAVAARMGPAKSSF